MPLTDLPGILSVISGHPKGRSVVRGVRVAVALSLPHPTLFGGFVSPVSSHCCLSPWRLKWSVADLVSMRNLRVDAEIPEADEETVEE